MESCADRICQALRIRNMKQSELSERTGIPKSAISQYCSGAFKPKQQRLFAIAKVLDVDEAWLMGLDVPMERNLEQKGGTGRMTPLFGDFGCISENIISGISIDSAKFALLSAFEKLNDHNQRIAVKRVTELGETPTPLSERCIPDRNIIRIAGRDGSYEERILTDDQIAAIKIILSQLPDASGDL